MALVTDARMRTLNRTFRGVDQRDRRAVVSRPSPAALRRPSQAAGLQPTAEASSPQAPSPEALRRPRHRHGGGGPPGTGRGARFGHGTEDSGPPWPSAPSGLRSRAGPGHHADVGRSAAAARGAAGRTDRAYAGTPPSPMIPVLLFLVIAGLLFFALVETAFSLLMRLPQRLEAERESTNGALATYLEDPLQFFIPSRVMRGILLVAAVVLLAQVDRPRLSGLARSPRQRRADFGRRWPDPADDHRAALAGARARDPASGLHRGRQPDRAAHGAHHGVDGTGPTPARRTATGRRMPARRRRPAPG